MFNLIDTGHAAGIIFQKRSVIACNWDFCDENETPILALFGALMAWPEGDETDTELIHVAHVDDVRDYLPGTVWVEDNELRTDMDIVYDVNYDIPALWGYGPSADVYNDIPKPYEGDIWDLTNGKRVITIDLWH